MTDLLTQLVEQHAAERDKPRAVAVPTAAPNRDAELTERQRCWAAMPPEMQADMQAISKAFGRFTLVSLTVDGERLK